MAFSSAGRDLIEAFVNFQYADLVRKLRPSTLNLRIFLSGSTRFFRYPVSKQDVLAVIAPAAIKNVVAQSFLFQRGHDLAHGAQGVALFSKKRFKDRHGQNLL